MRSRKKNYSQQIWHIEYEVDSTYESLKRDTNKTIA